MSSVVNLLSRRAPVILGAFLVVALSASCGRREPTAQQQPTAAATNTAAAQPLKPEFSKLAGRWERPDGGYTVEIRSINADGHMDVGYFNPSPINVARAVAVQDGATTKVFIELRDVNYPGCTYSLVYDAKSDQLYGQYYQAGIQETFDVVFARK